MNLAIDAAGTIYVTDHGTGFVRTIAPDGQVGTFGQVPSATGIAVDDAGNVYVSSDLNVIYRLAPDGTREVVAGSGAGGGLVDNESATSARFSHPLGLALAPDGTLYVADTWNNRLRKVH
jgi:sugar lactone lactonase YvrE